jgi:hypothetical protein
MITGKDISLIKKELLKLFPEAQKIQKKALSIKTEDKNNTQNHGYYFYLYLDKGKELILKMTPDYLEHHSIEEITKHLQRNIYYVMKSNINKTIYLLKNFEIEVEDMRFA